MENVVLCQTFHGHGFFVLVQGQFCDLHKSSKSEDGVTRFVKAAKNRFKGFHDVGFAHDQNLKRQEIVFKVRFGDSTIFMFALDLNLGGANWTRNNKRRIFQVHNTRLGKMHQFCETMRDQKRNELGRNGCPKLSS